VRRYGKRFVRRQMERESEDRDKTLDALLYAVDDATRTCQVYVSGSTQLVRVKFPTNWPSRPPWLKPGTSVRVVRLGGVRGMLEIVGYGIRIPGEATMPTIDPGEDTILTGMRLHAFRGAEFMNVWVEIGTYRIAGVEYTLGPIAAGGDEFPAGGFTPAGGVGAAKELSAAPAVGLYRYDLVVIAVDGVVDVVEGTAAAVPVMPEVPADHVRIGHVLVRGGTTYVTEGDVNATVQARQPRSLTVVPDDSELAWAELSTDVVVTVFDQWMQEFAGTGDGWQILLEIVQGNGEVSFPGEGSGSSVTGWTGATAQATFTYTRDGLASDFSPTLRATLIHTYRAVGVCVITLLDEFGNQMWGTGGPTS